MWCFIIKVVLEVVEHAQYNINLEGLYSYFIFTKSLLE